MTMDPDNDTTVLMSGPTLRRRLARRIHRMWVWLKVPMILRRGYFVLATMLALLTVVLVVRQVEALGQRAHAADIKRIDQAAFTNKHLTWISLKEQFNTCNSTTKTRLDLRGALLLMADLSDLFPGNKGAEAYTASRQSTLDEKYPPLDPARCVDPGAEPIPPKGLFP